MKWRGYSHRVSEKMTASDGITAGVAVRIITVYTLSVVFVSALVMWLIDDESNFPNFGTALWWAVQTVTTVGYGDIVPETLAGRVVAGIVMMSGIALITVVAGVVASGLARSVARRRGNDAQEHILRELDAIHRRLDELGAPPRD